MINFYTFHINSPYPVAEGDPANPVLDNFKTGFSGSPSATGYQGQQGLQGRQGRQLSICVF